MLGCCLFLNLHVESTHRSLHHGGVQWLLSGTVLDYDAIDYILHLDRGVQLTEAWVVGTAVVFD